MSHALTSRSPDLSRLQDEGYGVGIVDGALVVEPVPFLTKDGQVKAGALVMPLDLRDGRTTKPQSHVAYFAGGTPHDAAGQALTALINGNTNTQMGGKTLSHSMSSKPGPAGYANYYDKASVYADAIANHATAIDPDSTARCYPVVASDDEGPFRYLDTSSARNGVDTSLFRDLSIGLVGIGGTGSYIVDHVAKTHVDEIYLYDGDPLLQHNSFRAPGVVTEHELQQGWNKAEYWAEVTSRLRTGVVARSYRIDESNVRELTRHDYVFCCVDDNNTRRLIADALVRSGTPLIDCGLGLYQTDGRQLGGLVRVTTATRGHTEHLATVLPAGDAGNNEYDLNVQTSDLNALSAALAVIKWKKLIGMYADMDREHDATYVLSGNVIQNEAAA